MGESIGARPPGPDPSRPRSLVTEPGAGYRLRGPYDQVS